MKCERCGKREAQFFYKNTVNGVKTEECSLCSECAEREGYLNRDRWNFGWEEDWFGMPSFLSPLSPFPQSMTRFLPQSRQADAPQRRTPRHPYPKQESSIDTGDIQRERRRNELRIALEKAVQQEEYERAATLRDELKQLEQQK